MKITSEKQLIKILKIISEESVKKSRKILSESPYDIQDMYMQGIEQDENLYGVSLTEQDGEDEEADEDEEVVEDEEAAKDNDGKAEEEEAEPSEEELDPENFGVSFDGVVKAINSLRAGRSTKDKEIKEELLEYYERISEDERKVLYLFLRELSKILQGALDGGDAIDPSDPPFNIDIHAGGEDDSDDQPEVESDISGEETDRSGEENTAPPIKVNERQELNEIRRKVQRLMKRF